MTGTKESFHTTGNTLEPVGCRKHCWPM